MLNDELAGLGKEVSLFYLCTTFRGVKKIRITALNFSFNSWTPGQDRDLSKEKVKFALEQVVKAQRGSRDIALLFL